jgi:DNA-binding Lrp family transcriptional regulator
MLDIDAVDELDLAIVDALQCWPRASWVRVAQALGVDAATVARRWQRLTKAGLAWTTAYTTDLGNRRFAVVRVETAPGREATVAASLLGNPRVLTISVDSGDHALILEAIGDGAELSAYVLDELPRQPYVVRTGSHIVTQLLVDGSCWRIGALDARQRRLLTDETVLAPGPQKGPVDEALLTALEADARSGATQLARRLNLSPAQVRRRLNRLESTGSVRFRCDIARALSGAPITLRTWARVPAAARADASRVLGSLRHVRACYGLIGRANILLTSYHPLPADADTFVETLARHWPGVEIIDQAVELRMFKWMGRILDQDGLAIGHVPTALGTM